MKKSWWSNLPYWLKSGIIVGLIGVIFFISLVLISEKGSLRCMPYSPSDYFLECNIFMWILQPMAFGAIIVYFIAGFVIGSIIGLIYGRFKKKK